MIKAVIFDCFGVLYVDPTAYFYQLASARHSKELHEGFAHLLRQANSGLLSEDDFCTRVGELFQLPAETARTKLHKGVARNMPLVEYVKQLRLAYKVALLSNISKGTMDLFFPPTERQELFDDCVLSAEVGMVKPNPDIFTLAAERLGVLPEEAVFIDDNQRNCDGARSTRMHAIHFRSNDQLIAELKALLAV